MKMIIESLFADFHQLAIQYEFSFDFTVVSLAADENHSFVFPDFRRFAAKKAVASAKIHSLPSID